MAASERKTQVAIVGAGPGGYSAAFRAAGLGLSVTLVDEEARPGGVCLFRGCIPSKALLHVAKVIDDAEEATSFGVSFAPPDIELAELRSFKEGVIDKLTSGLAQLSKRHDIRYVQGRAALDGPNRLQVQTSSGGTEAVDFDHVILATGSKPTHPSGLWLESPRVLDSTSALELEEVPGRLLVVGGGYIGLELGSVYAALGSKVSVVEMTPGLLPGVDRDLVRVLAKRLDGLFEAVLLETKVASLSETADGIRVALEGEGLEKTEEDYDRVLVAVGRNPHSSIDGLAETKVQIDRQGFIGVDARQRTAEPTILAIGDVAGGPMLAHKAFLEGKVAAEVLAGDETAVFEPQAIPAVVFTDPEIAWCGLTETEAKESGRAVELARFPWEASGRALTLGRGQGLTKLVVEPETRRILGAGFAGPGAGELVAEGVLAVEMAATVDDVALSIHPHPTLSETMMEAAEVYLGHATHIYRPKR